MNPHQRCSGVLYYVILLLGTSILAGILSGCTTPASSSATIRRSANKENEYFIDGEGINKFEPGSLLAVYAQDPAGFEFDAAVMYITDRNVNNLIAQTIFQNPNITLDTLAALRVDNNLKDVDLASMVSVDAAFVGFTLGKGQIRINPNEPVHPGDELSAVKLTVLGDDALPLSPLLLFHVDAVSISGEMASASIVGAGSWPKDWTLLLPQNRSNTYTIMVNDFFPATEICVRKGEQVKVHAEGTMIVGEFVGVLGPEGKEYFQILGISTPIDPIYDIVPEFPHGVLMFRIADPTLSANEGWMPYDKTKQFEAARAGCLEFDINDKDNSDNSGAFSVKVEVNP